MHVEVEAADQLAVFIDPPGGYMRANSLFDTPRTAVCVMTLPQIPD
jgi:hypothetical protein